MNMKKSEKVKKIVKESYAEIAKSPGGCGCIQRQSGQIGYSQDEMSKAPAGSNLGLGCGNPVAISSLKEGEVVLDLGSGAGFDAFLAARKAGTKGKVIGVDMTDEMLKKARENAIKGGFTNVEFREGDIENLPVDDNSVDVIISNCVINLSPDKEKVFKEIHRVLKTGGRLMVSDTVLTKPLPDEIRNDKKLLTGCVSGAMLRDEYIKLIKSVGFLNLTIHKEQPGFLKDYSLSITYSAVK